MTDQLIEKGRLVEANLRDGILIASMHEGMFKDRIITMMVGKDPEFLSKLGARLGLPSGKEKVPTHKITITIE